jgi:hypothetical protein
MVTIIQFPEILQHPQNYKPDDIQKSWVGLVDRIGKSMADSKPVIVRGWIRDLPSDFSPNSMRNNFGDLGQRAQWFDTISFAQNRDIDVDDDGLLPPYHFQSTLQDFLDKIEDTSVCGNWLDCRHLHPNPPSFITPLLHSTQAWNQTFHLQFIQKPTQKGYTTSFAGPQVIKPANWSSHGWRLVSHPGAFTHPHNDCCGLCTYVVAETGCKIWAIMQPKSTEVYLNRADALERYRNIRDQIPQSGYDCDMASIMLEDFDIM